MFLVNFKYWFVFFNLPVWNCRFRVGLGSDSKPAIRFLWRLEPASNKPFTVPSRFRPDFGFDWFRASSGSVLSLTRPVATTNYRMTYGIISHVKYTIIAFNDAITNIFLIWKKIEILYFLIPKLKHLTFWENLKTMCF